VAGNGSGTYVFTGTGTPGDTVFVTVNGSTVPGSATVQPDGTWSFSSSTSVTPGDSIVAHSGSPAGPGSTAVAAGPAAPVTVTPGATPVAGGATVIGFSGTAGQVVTVVDAGTGQVLGSGTVPATGQAVVILDVPVTTGEVLRLVVNGQAGPTLPAAGAAQTAPVLIDGVVLVEGSTISAQGSPGSSIQVVDAEGRVLGSVLPDATGHADIPVSGAVAGVPVKLVQNGVAQDLPSPAVKLGNETAFLNQNVFKPNAGVPLAINVKAVTDGHLTVRIFNVAGEAVRQVASMDVRAGLIYGMQWNGRNEDGETVSAGLYVVSVQGAGATRLRKVVVLK
jgi:hypothetical protein